MARTIKDFTLNLGKYNKLEEVDEKNAFVLAVRNILLSKPGNFPLTPNLGMDIEQYLFEPADEYTLNKIGYLRNVRPEVLLQDVLYLFKRQQGDKTMAQITYSTAPNRKKMQ